MVGYKTLVYMYGTLDSEKCIIPSQIQQKWRGDCNVKGDKQYFSTRSRKQSLVYKRLWGVDTPTKYLIWQFLDALNLTLSCHAWWQWLVLWILTLNKCAITADFHWKWLFVFLQNQNCPKWTPSDNTKICAFCLYVSDTKIPPNAQKQHLQ